MKKIVKKIKENKKYRGIADEVVEGEVKRYLKEGGDKISSIKEVRKRLHLKYASFQTKGKRKIERYLDELKKDVNNFEIIDKLLSVSLSTKERLSDYEEIYSRIFNVVGAGDGGVVASRVVDLGGGLNGFSFSYMNLDNLTYYSYDIDVEDSRLLNQFFKIMKSNGLNGKADILDIRNSDEVKKLPKSDVVFLFKVVDVIDDKGHGNSEKLIEVLFDKTKFVVVSFATRTITRRKMNYPQRKWFELMCERRGWKFKRLDFDNEIFYVIES